MESLNINGSVASLLRCLSVALVTVAPAPVAQANAPTSCDPLEPGALAAKWSDVSAKPKGHRRAEFANLRLTRAQSLEGECIGDIERFVAGNAILKSGQIFVIGNTGSVTLHPRQGLDADESVAVKQIPALPGYTLISTRSLGWRPHASGRRQIYLGLFKRKSESVIARFDMIEGRPSKTAEVLIRATAPISGLGFLPAADTSEGGIGFVQQAGPNKAWLYSYSWQHGELEPLKF